MVASPAVYHEHIIFLIHSSFYHDTRTRSTTGTTWSAPRNTQYITHLQAFSVDKQRHQESLWRENLQSGGNPRTPDNAQAHTNTRTPSPRPLLPDPPPPDLLLSRTPAPTPLPRTIHNFAFFFFEFISRPFVQRPGLHKMSRELQIFVFCMVFENQMAEITNTSPRGTWKIEKSLKKGSGKKKKRDILARIPSAHPHILSAPTWSGFGPPTLRTPSFRPPPSGPHFFQVSAPTFRPPLLQDLGHLVSSHAEGSRKSQKHFFYTVPQIPSPPLDPLRRTSFCLGPLPRPFAWTALHPFGLPFGPPLLLGFGPTFRPPLLDLGHLVSSHPEGSRKSKKNTGNFFKDVRVFTPPKILAIFGPPS